MTNHLDAKLKDTFNESKSLRNFVRIHRSEIDGVASANGVSVGLSDLDREEWVNNNEGLYNLAKSWGWKG